MSVRTNVSVRPLCGERVREPRALTEVRERPITRRAASASLTSEYTGRDRAPGGVANLLATRRALRGTPVAAFSSSGHLAIWRFLSPRSHPALWAFTFAIASITAAWIARSQHTMPAFFSSPRPCPNSSGLPYTSLTTHPLSLATSDPAA